MEQNFTINQINDQEEVFSLKEFLSQCLANWQWFICSLLIFLCIGVFYILRQQPQYSRSMAVLIKDQDSGGSADISSAFSSMGLVSSNTNVNNELISLTSPAIMYEVINRLGLNVNYSTSGTFHRNTLYGTNLPVIVKFHDLEEQQAAGFEMEYYPDGKKELSKFYIMTPEGKVKYDKIVKVPADAELVRTPIGKVSILPNPGYAPKTKLTKPLDIRVGCMGMQSAVEAYSARLKGDLADKEAEVIDLSIKDVSPQRAVDVLNTIVTIYNENWVEDKNRVAVATSNFIDERLRVIEQELGVVDSDISSYKSAHLIPDLGEAAKLYMQQSAEKGDEILYNTNRLAMVNYLKDYISSPGNSYNVIPVNTGVGSAQLENQIASYNNLLLTRNNLVSNSSEANPIVQDYDAQLKGMRESINRAVNAQATSIKTSLGNIRGARGSAQSQLASGPTQAKYLLSVERQQKVKESLYLYLLQKREENQLTQTFTAYNTRIITPPTGSLSPVSPKKGMILIVAFLLGLAVPGVALYIAEATNTKVRGRKDLENMAPPFAGEIPMVGRNRPFARITGFKAKTKKGENEKALAVVKEGSRDTINEAFRIVRGNIDFMIGNHDASNVIMLTSFNPGSGKSFISYNLASSFGLKGKKVLVIDCDLRHGSLSQYIGMPHKGLSNYLTGHTDDWHSLIVKVADNANVFVMPIGHRPPNPAELLDNGRIGELLDAMRQEYDYVLLDCPPVDVVVDTQIIEKYVDRTIIVIRAGLFDKKVLLELDEIYNSKRFKQMSVILNGTDKSHSRYGAKGYHNSYYGNDK